MESSIPHSSDDLEQQPQIERDESIQVVCSCLNRTLRITLCDERVVEGVLDCYDNLGNMLLRNATDVSGRCYRLGTVLVPARVRVQVLVRRPAPEQTNPQTHNLQAGSLSNSSTNPTAPLLSTRERGSEIADKLIS